MSDTKLDPASLTAEERAIVEDAVSHHAFFDADGNIVECDEWTWCYRSAIARILARRALFAPPASEEKVTKYKCRECGEVSTYPDCCNYGTQNPEKVEPAQPEPAATEMPCPECGQPTTGNVFMSDHLCRPPAPPSEMPPQDEVKAVAHNVRECGSDEAAALILALSLVKWRSQPEPTPPSEMPIDRARQIAAQCWCDPETESIEMDARLAEAFARRLVEFRRPQPAPALRMTPELEMVLGFAAETTKMRDDDESWMEEHLDKMQGIIAAVRAQASQPQGVKLPKVREALITLSGCIYLQENMDKVIAALAELDAAEWKVTG